MCFGCGLLRPLLSCDLPHPFPSMCRKSKEEQRQYEQRRAEEIYESLQRAKSIAQKRAEQMSRSVEVCVCVCVCVCVFGVVYVCVVLRCNFVP